MIHLIQVDFEMVYRQSLWRKGIEGSRFRRHGQDRLSRSLGSGEFGGAETIGIVGRSQDALQKDRDWIGSERVTTHLLDINDARRVRTLMKEYDVGIYHPADRRSSYKTIETAIGSGLDVVDILEEYHRRLTL